MANSRIRYLGVPDKSTLKLHATGDGPCTIEAVVACDDHETFNYSKSDMDPDPAEILIHSPCFYIARIDIHMTSVKTNSVTVRTSVIRHNGEQHSSTKSVTFKRTDGATNFVQVLLVTEQLQ